MAAKDEKLSKSEILQLQSDHNVYVEWMRGEFDDGLSKADLMRRRQKIVLNAIHVFLTDRQRDYILDYIDGDMTMREIGRKYGVDPSSVSRQIKAGHVKLRRVLSCVAPEIGLVNVNALDLRNAFYADADTGGMKLRKRRPNRKRKKKGGDA